MVGRFSLPFKGSFPSILKAITFFLFFFFGIEDLYQNIMNFVCDFFLLILSGT